ncbi:NECAP-like protein CG9132 isoform X2 [Eriocheir sinensis]|uniref:NECAP-like protein CG9132 isoform X2 n=1 Tax=Eriocheir sinensis TaxID=95602 RepID=UPI0021C6CAFC|nr:NECAP-like protein CG9132 isoform X2 [Eriocheir sinensis]
MDDYESVLLVKPEVFVYRIPPRSSNRGYRAADWNLGAPDWTGRMRLVNRSDGCVIKLEDKVTGELFAKCPIDKYPGVALEAVTDSSRYFVLRIQDEGVIGDVAGRAAFIGVGFGDRSDSFDLNVALQDHFKWVKKEEEAEKEKEEGKPNLDLGFKDGETIKINMKITKKEGQEGTNRPKPKAGSAGGGLLPPPPGGVKLAPPPAPVAASKIGSGSNIDILGDLSNSPTHSDSKPAAAGCGESWGDFASAPAKPQPARIGGKASVWLE